MLIHAYYVDSTTSMVFVPLWVSNDDDDKDAEDVEEDRGGEEVEEVEEEEEQIRDSF